MLFENLSIFRIFEILYGFRMTFVSLNNNLLFCWAPIFSILSWIRNLLMIWWRVINIRNFEFVSAKCNNSSKFRVSNMSRSTSLFKSSKLKVLSLTLFAFTLLWPNKILRKANGIYFCLSLKLEAIDGKIENTNEASDQNGNCNWN